MAHRKRRCPSFRTWCRLIVACCVAVCSPALAQPKPGAKKAPPVEFVSIELGWDGVIPGDRWCPVIVRVTSQTKAFSGFMTVEYPQDPTQETRVVAPIATTPGMVTPVEVAVSLPPACAYVTFKIYDDRWREQDRIEYVQNGSNDELPLPHIGAHGGLIVTLGASTARLAVERYQLSSPGDGAGPKKSTAPNPAPLNYYQPQTGPVDLWEQVQLSRIQPDHLPMSWAAYEGVDLFIAQADVLARCDARAKAALMDWVRAGGRLLIQADPAGSDWRSFLPKGPDGELITLDPMQKVAAGPQLARLAQSKPVLASKLPPTLIEPIEIDKDPAATSARIIHLTETGASRGWTITWPLGGSAVMGSSAVPAESSETSAGPHSSIGLKASGPVGLGIVTVIGFDPQSLPRTIDPQVTRAIWRDAISTAIGPHATHAAKGGLSSNPTYWYGGYTDDPETDFAIHAALDQSATIPPLGSGIFIAIASCMLLLVLLLGPFDGLVLRRFGQSQRSWLTALLWISIASLAAYLAPRALRSGRTAAQRLTACDTICDQDGLAVSTCCTAVTGIFGGRSISVSLDGAPKGGWFRGVSSLEPYGDHPRSLFSPLTLPITVQEQDPYLRGTPPEPFSVAQWTFRGLLDQCPLHTAKGTEIGAKVRASADGTYGVTLINVPAGIRSQSALLQIGGNEYRFVLDSRDDTSPSPGSLHDLVGVATPVYPLAVTKPSTPGPSAVATKPTAAPLDSTIASNLPGARDRTDAMEAMLKSGRWACLSLRLNNLPMDITLSKVPSLESTRTAYLRILTPVER